MGKRIGIFHGSKEKSRVDKSVSFWYHKIMKEETSHKNRRGEIGISSGFIDLDKLSNNLSNIDYIKNLHPRIDILINRIFSKLTVIGFSHIKNERAYWICQCGCGKSNKLFRS